MFAVRYLYLSLNPRMRRRGTDIHVGVRAGGIFPLNQPVRLAPVAVATLGPAVHKGTVEVWVTRGGKRPVGLESVVTLSLATRIFGKSILLRSLIALCQRLCKW